VWLYRLVLFLGIAILVYHFFIKLLGIVLFVVEIGVFVVQPIWREIAAWRKRAGVIRHSPRALRSLMLLAALVLVGFIPWNGHVSGQGVLRTHQFFALYAPGPARIEHLAVHGGEQVAAGSVLVALEMPDLAQRHRQATQRLQQLQWQLEVSGLDDDLRANQTVIREELAGAKAQLEGASQERARFEVHAPFAGVIVDVPPELRDGVWVNPRERLGVLVDPSAWRVETYLEESAIQRVQVGNVARFFSEASPAKPLALTVVRIDPDATRQLPEPMLAAQHGGQIVVRERNNHLIPQQAIYRVVLQVQPGSFEPTASHSLRGRVVIDGERKSLLGDYLRTAATVIIREAGW
jgi:putative peptide zinc metalloprotease protein